ncbi:MAG: hypothetical protein QX189_20050 [Methylococcales bacterium]
MSAEAFKEVASKIPELKFWSSGQKDTSSILHKGRKESRSFIDSTKVEHIIPLSQLSDMIGVREANLIFNEIKTGKYITGFEDVAYLNTGGQETIIFKEVTFSSLNTYITGYLDSVLLVADPSHGSIKQSLLDKISANKLHKGHVYGWANTLVNRTKDSIGQIISAQSDRPKEEVAKDLITLNTFIDSLLDVLESYDEQCSSIKGLNTTVFAKYRKTSSNWLLSWESHAGNISSGTAVGKAVGLSSDKGVRSFIKNATAAHDSLASKALEGMVKGFIDATISAKGDKNLINLRSSPGMSELIVDDIISSLTGKPKKLKSEYTGSIPNIANLALRKVDNTKAKQSILKAKTQLKGLGNKTKAALAKVKLSPTAVRSMEGQFYSLASLQQLINDSLQHVISANMGDGSQKDVLNYRSGRFAGSASVKTLSQSREGMITAFYTYMKNPYQTFEPGFAQGSPKTRDPKLLIAKSIREIAATKVGNRMRAVLV